MFIAVINTDETIIDALHDNFEKCIIEDETVIINGIIYEYYPINVIAMPVKNVTIYELVEITSKTN